MSEMRGGSDCGCLANVSLKTSGEGGARPMEVRDCRAFLYCPPSTTQRAREALLRWSVSQDGGLDFAHAERDLRPFILNEASVHKPSKSPSFHHLIRVCANLRVPRQ